MQRAEDRAAQRPVTHDKALAILDNGAVAFLVLEVHLDPGDVSVLEFDRAAINGEAELYLCFKARYFASRLPHVQIVAALCLALAVMGVPMRAMRLLRAVF